MTDQFRGPPVRLQLSRRAGFNLQKLSIATNGRPAVNCARPGPYGNPFVVGVDTPTAERACIHFRAELLAHGRLVGPRRHLTLAQVKEALRGKNLACFCPLDAPHCHVDILLEAVNGD